MTTDVAGDEPRAIISVWGRFHAFDLARELQRIGGLSALITSYPAYITEKFGVERSRVRSCPFGEAISRLGRKVPALGRWANLDLQGKRLFQRSARRALRSLEGDVFVGWSGTSLPLLRDAKARGMVTVLERGSSHIVEQTKTLLDEHARFGVAFSDTPAETIEQELAEYEEADYIAVPSGFVAESFLQRGFSANKLLLTPYGADLSTFRPAPVAHEPFRIVQVGGVTIRKGFHHVAEAFAQADIPDSELWFIGGISAEARTYFSKHPDPRITLHGHIPQSDLPAFYNQCDVACLGSVEEGMAMVLLQAAACGLPIVCTHNTGGREVVGDGDEACGIVVPPRDPAAMAAAFRHMHANTTARRRLGTIARKRAESSFAWRHYAERALAHYRRIARWPRG
jgi:glycosyltransferase involved in cell wall biosynthesis